jgi:hypothetical protein
MMMTLEPVGTDKWNALQPVARQSAVYKAWISDTSQSASGVRHARDVTNPMG